MAGIIAGGKVTVRIWSMPPGADLLGMDGNQVWYGDAEGLGSTVSHDVGHCLVSGSLEFKASEDEVVHLIADGEAVTSCCGRTPFELPRGDRITVDPNLGRGCG